MEGLFNIVRLMSGIAVGVPGDPSIATERDREREHKVRRRRSLDALAHGDRWNEPWAGVREAPA